MFLCAGPSGTIDKKYTLSISPKQGLALQQSFRLTFFCKGHAKRYVVQAVCWYGIEINKFKPFDRSPLGRGLYEILEALFIGKPAITLK